MKEYCGTILALLVIYGIEDVNWYFMPIDTVEWTAPKFYHQN